MDKTITNRGENLEAAKQSAQQLLIELLQQGDEAQRCYAAGVVAANKISATEPALNDCLYHPDPDVVIDAASALAQLQGGNVDSLCEVVKYHPESDARIGALHALSHHLTLNPVDKLVQQIAQGRLADDKWGLSSDWDDWWDLQFEAVSILVEHPSPAYLKLFQEVLEQDPEPELESILYRGIAKLDASWITDRLLTAPLTERRKLLKALKFSETQLAKAFLYKHLTDDDPLCRRIAIEALTSKHASEYFGDIAKRLQDTDEQVQKAAITGLEQLSRYDEIDKSRLLSYLKTAAPAARTQLIQLMHQQSLEEQDYPLIIDMLCANEPNAFVAFLQQANPALLSSAQQQQLVSIAVELLENDQLGTHIQAPLIRALISLNSHIDALLPALEQRILRCKENSDVPFYDTSIRQACFDLISQLSHPNCQHLIRTAIFGLSAYPDTIEVNEAEKENEQNEALLEALAQHDVPAQYQTENTPSSTIAAITQTNLEAKLDVQHQQDDQQTNIVEMVNELDDELASFGQVVKEHFDSADNLNLNRKKIARLPEYDNKVLALRALGQASNPQAVEWLIEALLGANDSELREIFQSLTHQKKALNPSNQIHNAIGAAATTIFGGHPLTQQHALKYLACVPTSKALPLLLEALKSSDEHVRLSALFTVEQHLSKLTLQYKPVVKTAISVLLDDPAGGVRKQALKLSCLLREPDESIESVILLPIHDQECHTIAFQHFKMFQAHALNWLTQHLNSLSPEQQPNGIKLMGALMT
ncbi:HEAT repeat domain-containing protein [Vibrio sp. TRT 17S01]|uniref:HEAT repeat domain-containing protein n=1 Tax=Vibrio sp. TRT 17S01 TaxID=3418505 RepID=UPI003CEAFA0F